MIDKFLDQIRDVFIKRVLFVLVASFCYFYTIWGSNFAELKISFDFLNFPVFAGEILLFITFPITVVYYFKTRSLLPRRFFVLFVFYVLWLSAKTTMGYFSYGPLALRTSALFYYPFFALIGYAMFEKPFYNSAWRWGIWLFLLINVLWSPVSDYFLVAYWLLALGFCLHFLSKKLKWLGIGILVAHAFCTQFFFLSSRSHTVGVLVMSVFLAGYFIVGMLKVHWRTKLWAIAAAMIFVAVGLFVFADRNALISLVSFKEWREQFSLLDRDIQQRKKSYSPPKLKAKIYDMNRKNAAADNEPGPIKTVFLKPAPAPEKLDKVLSQNDAQPVEMFRDQETVPSLKKDKEKSYHKAAGVINDHEIKRQNDMGKPAKEQEQHVDRSSLTPIVRPRENVEQNIVSDVPAQKVERSLDVAYNNIFFRIFIWRDMLDDLKEKRAWWGMSFGHPQRSISIEILDWARIEWQRDGWITPHNSFLHMIYRGGIVGILCVMTIIGFLVYLIRGFLKFRCVWGGILIACLMYWVGISNFLVFLELPYNAIPFWTFFGMTVAYYHSLEKEKPSHG